MHPHLIPPRPRGLSGRASSAGRAVLPESLPAVVLVPVHPEPASRLPWRQIIGWLALVVLLGLVGFAVVRLLRPSEEEQRAMRGRAIEQEFANQSPIRPATASPPLSPASSPIAP